MSSVAALALEACELVDLKDRRRTARLRQLVSDMANHPDSSLPQTCEGWAGTLAAYRFLDNDHVTPEDIADGLCAGTATKLDGRRRILAIDDTTSLDFTTHPATAGLGHLEHPSHVGLLVHTTMAVSLEGVPLGILGQDSWARDPETKGQKQQRKQRPFEEKESAKWVRSERRWIQALRRDLELLDIKDAEADIYDVMAEPRRPGHYLLVRVAQAQRCVTAETRYLARTVEQFEVAGGMILNLQRADDQPARRATLEVRFGPVVVLPPQARASERLAPLPLWAVLATEVGAPKGVKPLRWLLLTDEPLESLADAVQRVEWYHVRWLIERLHYVLKSGQQVEQLQLATAERLRRAVAVKTCVACAVLWLCYEARVHPDEPVTRLLADHEWRLLYARVTKQPPPTEPPTLREAVILLARLGGFLARRRDGMPGVKCLWRGVVAFYWLMEGHDTTRFLDVLDSEASRCV